ncbi:MAG TPA: AMP-binding protein [Anaerolineales bacterium]|nr:AMP-binding protein [Anaerolineales bacterium]HRQ91498.1 AMP-binding protein [Anaerolineales bacterium]
MPADFASGPIVWRPTPDYIENARLTEFMRAHSIASFDELMQRSTSDVAWFTDAVLTFLDIQFYTPYSNVLDLSRGIAWPQWCVGGEMNIVHNCLDKYQSGPHKERPALVWEGEDGQTRTLTYADLHAQVSQAANALRSLGIGKGDAVGIFMPMVPEIAVALLAIAKVGGIILPLFSGYGVEAVVSRLADGNAKALFTADSFPRRGKPVEMKSIADAAAAQLPGLQHIIVLDHAKLSVPFVRGRDHWWHELVDTQLPLAETERTSAEDPLMIIYTSGTTGRPKGALHTHCGFPVKAAQDMAFGTDVRPGHLIYWMTDMGWMMGPWLVFGTLLLGATFFLYDGAPDYPQPDRTWAQVAQHHITTLGISPTLVRVLMPLGDALPKAHDLTSLRFFGSTGEPWNPDPWLWLFNVVGEGKRPIINYSGGTEISGGIVMGNPILPLKATAFAGPCPGIAADVLDENGASVTGQVGELVIKAPWIGMTRGFWGDPERYEDTYWSRWANTWVHGDWAARDEDGQWYILGRSDDTIKIAGKRLGPAEVESVLVAHPAVVEAAAIAVPDELKGNVVVALCVLAQGAAGGYALAAELRALLADALGKPLAPKEILFVPDLPKTRNAKVMRRMVRAAYLGQDAGDTSSLVNPQAVEHIRNTVKRLGD